MAKILIWMMCSKHLKTVLKTRFKGIEEIELVEDILTSYSHAKVNKLFSVSNIKILFEIFMTHGKEEFISSFSGEQKSKYEEALNQIMSGFAINNSI